MRITPLVASLARPARVGPDSPLLRVLIATLLDVCTHTTFGGVYTDNDIILGCERVFVESLCALLLGGEAGVLLCVCGICDYPENFNGTRWVVGRCARPL